MKVCGSTVAFLPCHKTLQHISISDSELRELSGLEYLHNLKELYIKYGARRLTTLTFTPVQANIKVLHIKGTGITEINGLEHLKNLTDLSLKDLEKLPSLSFHSGMDHLKNLILWGEGLKEIKGLNHLKGLELLELLGLYSLNSLQFGSPMPALQNLRIVASPSVQGFENLINLKSIDISGLSKVETLVFYHSHHKLELLNVREATVNEFHGFRYLTNLKHMQLSYQRNFLTKNLVFAPEMNCLTSLFIYDYSGTELRALDTLKSLQILKLTRLQHLEKIEFTQEMESLKEIEIEDSGIKSFQGLENLPALEQLCLKQTPNLKELKLSSQLGNLNYLNIWDSGCLDLQGLDLLPSLGHLNILNTNIAVIEFPLAPYSLAGLAISGAHIHAVEGLSFLTNLETLSISSV